MRVFLSPTSLINLSLDLCLIHVGFDLLERSMNYLSKYKFQSLDHFNQILPSVKDFSFFKPNSLCTLDLKSVLNYSSIYIIYEFLLNNNYL